MSMQDMVSRDRSLTGTRNPSAKLDYDRAADIRSFVASGNTYEKAAARFGVGASTVSRIMRGVVWAER